MFKFLGKIFDSNEKVIDRYKKTVQSINDLEPEFQKLKLPDFPKKTQEFKERLVNGETLDQILPQAFALVREASRRTLGLRHFDVQLMAGIGFHEGRVSEQKTGEGKTLSATSALYLNALVGKGAHLVTVNDYLAQRDAGWMSPVFHLLGLKVGVIYSGQGDLPASIFDPEYQGVDRGDDRLEHLKPVDRKEAYAADITYGTNNEFGFDYLRDNMAQNLDQLVQRGHYFAIVDEVDSILIDEARTPLIISAPDTEPTKKYYEFAKLVDSLTKETDYTVDEKHRSVALTDYGLRRLEKRLNVDNLYEKDYETIHHVEQALKAKTIFTRDKDYVVKDGQVIIVDEHTGRLMFGRRYSEGLHQAIEAKEGVDIQRESRTLATISLQNYFRMYKKLAGMTGTAQTEAEEFKTIYNMDVVVVPTNVEVARKDFPDVVYKTKRAKMGAIVKEVRERFEAGQPVLLGTKSIEQNEIMSRYLKKMKIPHNLLNAKNHESEAKILSDAGKPKAITVATNIAGRGVDIVLGGSPPSKPNKNADDKAKKVYEEAFAVWQNSHRQVIDLGGLHVIGTDRHDSRRIDNQLRGRSGRQGDPGSSRFYVSLEDDLMRIFGGAQVAKFMDILKIPEDQPIESGMVSKSLEQAQSKVEGFYLDQRKRVVEYDDVMNKQREIIYKRRQAILEAGTNDAKAQTLRDRIYGYLHEQIESLVNSRNSVESGLDHQGILAEFLTIIPYDKNSQDNILKKLKEAADEKAATSLLTDIIDQTYQSRVENIGEPAMREIERYVLLSTIDKAWMDHLDAMDDLREGIWLRGGKETVLSEYKKEAFDMFALLLDGINAQAARLIFRVQINAMPQQPTMPQGIAGRDDSFIDKPTADSQPASPSKSQPANVQSLGALAAALAKTSNRAGDKANARTMTLIKPDENGNKIGRNDPCPCGAINPTTGKPYKWKKCGMINAPYHKA